MPVAVAAGTAARSSSTTTCQESTTIKPNSIKITVFLITRKTFGLCAFVLLSVIFLCISSFHLLLFLFLDSGF